jgi:hypothetical protein
MGAFGDIISNFFHPKGLDDPANAQKLQDTLKQADEEGKQLADAGIAFIEALLANANVNLGRLQGTLDKAISLLDELRESPLDPNDYKTKVVKASDALQTLKEFRTDQLLDFFKSQFQDIRDQCRDQLSGEALTNMAKGIIGMSPDALDQILNIIDALLTIATDVAEIFHFLDDREQEIADACLGQTNPEVVSVDKHRTRVQ